MAVRVDVQLVQITDQKVDAVVRVDVQLVQYARDADIDPNFRVDSQVVQVAKGFSPVEILVKSTSYPKLHPLSFFARTGSKSFIKGPNFARVDTQVVQVARLVVPN